MDPGKVIHYSAEGFSEFTVLLFIPTNRPIEMQFGDMNFGPRLYINRVLIMDNCEQLLPSYLRFVKGVVDCPDLPLNVSREMLQENAKLGRIQKHVVKNVLKGLEELRADNYEQYVEFYRQLGEIFKEGLAQDFENREKIAELLIFESIKSEPNEYTSLDQYIENMPDEQEEIYFLTGESRGAIENAPYLEVFKDRDWDVLLLTDPVDEFIVPHLSEYKEKKLRAANHADMQEEESEDLTSLKEAYLPLLENLRQKLDGIKEVKLSTRLTASASCLVSEEGAIGANMERILKRLNQDQEIPEQERILELNPEHEIVVALKKLFEENPDDPKITNYGKLLYDQAVIAEGSNLPDPVEFAKRINDLILKDAGVTTDS